MTVVANIETREQGGCREVLDPVRRKWVKLTPEEWVRQQAISILHAAGYPLEVMQVEGTITLNGMSRRCDIVVHSPSGEAWMIVECKAPQVPITQRVADQACRYNTVLHVPWLLLTNGRQNLILHVDFQAATLQQHSALPPWPKC